MLPAAASIAAAAEPLAPLQPVPLAPFLSQKMRFWGLVAMVLLIYVHGYNLHPRQLDPWTVVQEPLGPGTFLQYFLSNGLLRFRIPILFAISGYLFAYTAGRTTHGARLLKRLRTLGLPYLLWSAIWLGIGWALEQAPATRWAIIHAEISPFWPRQLLSQLSANELLGRWAMLPLPFQFWFLRDLLALNIAYPLLRRAMLRAPKIYFPLVALTWFLGFDLLLVISSEGLLFFSVGAWLALRGLDPQTRPAWLRVPVVAVIWVAAAAAMTALAFTLPPPQGPSAGTLAMLTLYRLTEAAGVLTAWFGLDWLVRRAMAQAWVRGLTGFSFLLYVLHVPTVNYATTLALRYGQGIPHISLLTYLLLPVALVAAIVAIGAALRALAPGAYGLLTGGRGL